MFVKNINNGWVIYIYTLSILSFEDVILQISSGGGRYTLFCKY